MHDFVSWAKQLGYDNLSDVTLDGKFHRFKGQGKTGKTGWYIGYQNHSARSGKTYIIATIGDWATGESHKYAPQKYISPEDRAVIKKQLEQMKRRQQREKEELQKKAADTAQKIWDGASDDPNGCKYLEKKRLNKLYGARVYDDVLLGKTLFVPARNARGDIVGGQRIYLDGTKRFIYGGQLTGAFHKIGNIKNRAYICEGWSTGGTIYDCTNTPVVCAFNAGNLESVTKVLLKLYPQTKFIIAGDDDKYHDDPRKKNAGRIYAEAAAKLTGNPPVFPVFKDEKTKPTDFNDLFCLEGREAVCHALESTVRKINSPLTTDLATSTCGGGLPFAPLGVLDGKCFVFKDITKTVEVVRGAGNNDLLHIAPHDWWEMRFCNDKGKIDWARANDFVIRLCEEKGIFSHNFLRGTGVWRDGEAIVFNNGTFAINKPPVSSFTYVGSQNRLPSAIAKPLSTRDASVLVDCANLFRWKDGKFGYLLAGWLAVARIAGALPVRPHIWLTGASSTGKSTIMTRLISPALGCAFAKRFCQGGTTEAGIRQMIRSDSIPLIFDEFEPEDKKTSDRTKSIIELLRQAWSSDGGVIVKGSASGMHSSYVASFVALVASINTALPCEADRSRFTVIELARHGSDLEHWQLLDQTLQKISEDFGESLFARSLAMVDIIKNSYHVFKGVLAQKINSRFGQQYGMLLAGLYSLQCDDTVDAATAEKIVAELDFSTEIDLASETDDGDCLTHLLTSRITIQGVDFEDGVTKPLTNSVESIIGRNIGPQIDSLQNFGIRLLPDGRLFVVSNHTELRKIFRDTRWENNWAAALVRFKGAERCVQRIFKTPKKGVALPLLLNEPGQ